MIAHNKRFSDTTVNLDGATFMGCSFERCRFVFSGYMPVSLSGNTFKDCTWELAGPASNSMDFLASLFQGGAASMVEAVFDNIRKGGLGDGGPVRMN